MTHQFKNETTADQNILQQIHWILFISVPFLLTLSFLPWQKARHAAAIAFIILSGIIFLLTFFQKIKIEKQDRWLIFFIVLNIISHLISATFSIDPKESLIGSDVRFFGLLPQLAAFLPLVILVMTKPSLKKLNIIFKYFCIPIAAIAIFGMTQSYFGISPFDTQFFQGRIDSILGNPNILALFLLMTFPLVASLLKTEQKKKWIFGILLVVMILDMFLSGSRTGTLLLGTEIFIFALLEFFKKNKKIALTILLITTIIFLFAPKGILERYMMEQPIPTSLETRLHIWRDTIPVIKEKPFFGFGQDQFEDAFKMHSNSQLLGNPLMVDRAHNIMLDTLVDRGIFGLLAWLALIAYVAIQFFQKKIPASPRNIALTVSALNFLLFLQMNFSDILNETLFWLIIGLLVVSRQRGTVSI